jgi:hypothetical protein
MRRKFNHETTKAIADPFRGELGDDVVRTVDGRNFVRLKILVKIGDFHYIPRTTINVRWLFLSSTGKAPYIGPRSQSFHRD